MLIDAVFEVLSWDLLQSLTAKRRICSSKIDRLF